MDRLEYIDKLGERFRAAFPNSYFSITYEANFFKSGHVEKKWYLYMLIMEDRETTPTKVNEYYSEFINLDERVNHFLVSADAYKTDPDAKVEYEH